MNRLDLLKRAKAAVDAINAEKRVTETEDNDESESVDLAIRMQQHDAVIEALDELKINRDILNKIAEAIANIKVPEATVKVEIPEIKVPEAKVTVSIPEITIPPIHVPEPKVTVNVPPQPAPIVNIEEKDVLFPDFMDVGLQNVSPKNPLHVMTVGPDGKFVSPTGGSGGPRYVKINNTVDEPIPISGNITSTPGATYYASDAIGSVNIVQSIPIDVTVTGATATIGVVTINPDGLPVYGGSSSGGGLTDAELRATQLQVQQVSGYADSVSVIGTVGLTNTELRANSIDVQQASGASWSTSVLSMPAVVVTSITNSTAVTLLNGEGLARDTWGATQVGTWNIGTVSSVTNSIAVSLLNGGGTTLDPRDRNWTISETVPVSGTFYQATQPVSGTVTVASITASTASALVDSTGVQYSGSNPVPTKELRASTGTNTSVADNSASTTILASNTARLGATVYNDSSAILYLLLGSTAASTTNYTCKIASSGYYEVPFGYTGQLTGIWASDPNDGSARVTEIT
jgi:hypothetical protein